VGGRSCLLRSILCSRRLVSLSDILGGGSGVVLVTRSRGSSVTFVAGVRAITRLGSRCGDGSTSGRDLCSGGFALSRTVVLEVLSGL
jgi:hypothetical protein